MLTKNFVENFVMFFFVFFLCCNIYIFFYQFILPKYKIILLPFFEFLTGSCYIQDQRTMMMFKKTVIKVHLFNRITKLTPVFPYYRSAAGGPGGPQPAQPSKRLQQTQAQVDEVCYKTCIDFLMKNDSKIV